MTLSQENHFYIIQTRQLTFLKNTGKLVLKKSVFSALASLNMGSISKG